VVDAIKKTPALTFYVSNIMTEQGETDAYSCADHLEAILKHVGVQIFDYVVINNGLLDETRLKRYREEKAVPVQMSLKAIQEMGIEIIQDDLLLKSNLAWHDSEKLARLIINKLGIIRAVKV
jgi:uncharacterized cofD-like protein